MLPSNTSSTLLCLPLATVAEADARHHQAAATRGPHRQTTKTRVASCLPAAAADTHPGGAAPTSCAGSLDTTQRMLQQVQVQRWAAAGRQFQRPPECRLKLPSVSAAAASQPGQQHALAALCHPQSTVESSKLDCGFLSLKGHNCSTLLCSTRGLCNAPAVLAC
jgi:hypothetical protein